MIAWYLVYTKPRLEKVAELNLNREHFHSYLPFMPALRRHRGRYKTLIDPLFPRYLFIELDSQVGDWSKIRSTKGCISLVCFASIPAQVPLKLITYLKANEEARMKNTTNLTPEFKTGDRIRVLEGLLQDYEGIVKAKNSQERITLLLSLAEGHTREITLSAHQIEKV